ncbi:MAG: hypothetical protein ABSF90_30210 [Syntrophobacteraceae bacterium]
MASSRPKHNSPQTIYPKYTTRHPKNVAVRKAQTASCVSPPPKDSNNSNNSAQDRKFWRKKPIEAATLLIVLAYTLVSGAQWCAMRKSNEINREALQSVQRAFVWAAGFAAPLVIRHSLSGAERYLEFQVRWENSGATPAIGLAESFQAEDLPDEPTDAQIVGDIRDTDLTYVTISPKGSQVAGPIPKRTSSILGGQLDIVLDQRQPIHPIQRYFIWGWAAYYDVFTGTKPHVTEFCWRVNSISLNQQTGEPLFGTQLCKHHNCTDNYCEDYESLAKMAPQPPPIPK